MFSDEEVFEDFNNRNDKDRRRKNRERKLKDKKRHSSIYDYDDENGEYKRYRKKHR